MLSLRQKTKEQTDLVSEFKTSWIQHTVAYFRRRGKLCVHQS